MNAVDLNAAKMKILLDNNIDPAQKIEIMRQLEYAQQHFGSQVEISQIVGAGLTGLAAWLTSRFLGFGAGGQTAATLLGGYAGYNLFR
jgi:hypothetical protein